MSKIVISPELLDKYTSQQCTPEETQWVETWYAAQSGEKNYLSTLSDLDRNLLKESTLNNIRSQIGAALDTRETPIVKPVFWRSRVFQIGMAASLLLTFSGVWYWSYFLKSEKNNAVVFEAVTQPSGASVVHFVNQEARLVTHHLPDGTTVCLHPHAELTYPTAFSGNFRQVSFIGEGFFDVAHDSLHPFFIEIDKMQIKVLGTQFNVKALPEQAVFQVSVVSGSVAVRSVKATSNVNSEVIILKPQQKALFEVATKQLMAVEITESKKEIYEMISINFTDTPVGEVIEQLEKRFNIDIELSNKALAKCLLTADFNKQSLPVILEILCASLDVTYTLSGSTLILKGVGCE